MGPHWHQLTSFCNPKSKIAWGATVGVDFSQVMFDIVVEKEWAEVCPVDAHTILPRSTEVVRAAKRLPAHRLEPAEFSASVFWKFLTFHPDPSQTPLVWAVSTPGCSSTQIDIRGFSAGSYVGAAVALIACRIPVLSACT